MNKLVMPNTIKYKVAQDIVKIIFPMITWDNNTLRNIAAFFLKKYNLSSNTLVEIILDKNVSVSANHIVLGELDKVEISFNKPSERKTLAKEVHSFPLHGIIIAILLLLLTVAIVSRTKKK